MPSNALARKAAFNTAPPNLPLLTRVNSCGRARARACVCPPPPGEVSEKKKTRRRASYHWVQEIVGHGAEPQTHGLPLRRS